MAGTIENGGDRPGDTCALSSQLWPGSLPVLEVATDSTLDAHWPGMAAFYSPVTETAKRFGVYGWLKWYCDLFPAP